MSPCTSRAIYLGPGPPATSPSSGTAVYIALTFFGRGATHVEPRALTCESPASSGTGGYGDAVEGTEPASLKARIMLRAMRFGMSALPSSLAPVFGEVSLVRSHSVMAARS